MIMPPRRIVVPVTLSREGDARIAAAARLAAALRAELVLVGVAPLVPPAQWTAGVSRFVLLDREREAQRLMERLVVDRLEELRAALPSRVRARTVATWGPVDETLAEVAEIEDADMIVVSMREESPLAYVLGDAANASLVHHSDVPVLIVPEPRLSTGN
jgi:nucleotide-binding universal stress UspA family protein